MNEKHAVIFIFKLQQAHVPLLKHEAIQRLLKEKPPSLVVDAVPLRNKLHGVMKPHRYLGLFAANPTAMLKSPGLAAKELPAALFKTHFKGRM
eukprot:1622486-Amphidinium_carterae.1